MPWKQTNGPARPVFVSTSFNRLLVDPGPSYSVVSSLRVVRFVRAPQRQGDRSDLPRDRQLRQVRLRAAPDEFEVIGKWMVAVHDNTRAYQPWEKPYFVLSPGDRYDMRARRIVPPRVPVG